MQNHKASLKLGLGLFAFYLGVLASHPASAAVGFALTPTVVSNQYAGYITLQISNLTAGAAVVVQKFADANSNGVVDAGDVLVQQFQVTDGQAPMKFAGITNVNIPFDSNGTAGAITTQLSPATEGSVQRFVGQFLFVISSPTAQFAPITNALLVTNTAYGQKFTGTVSVGGSNIPNALVFLARAPSGGGGGDGFNPLGGVIADSSGNFKIKAAPGTYRLVAVKNGFVANLNAAPVLTLSNGITITTNLTMSTATRTVSGRLVDAGNNSVGLPAILMAVQSASKDLGLGATDTNGNFVLPALAEQLGFGMEQQSLDFQGYIGLNNSPTNVDATAGNVAGVTIAFPKATAMIYGSIKDNNNNPLSGVRLSGDNETNGNGPYQGDATTDPNGNYSMGVNADLWSPSVDNGENSIAFANYVFSQGPAWVFNNGGPGTNVSTGAAIQANFSAVLATNQITGYVRDNNNNPIVGVQVYAYATIGGNSYQSQQNTDSNGNYSLNVGNANWNVNVLCCCDNNSLQTLGNYQCPNNANVNIVNGNGVANFIAQTNSNNGGSYQLDGFVRDNLNNPIIGINVYANNGQGSNLTNSTDGSGHYAFNVGNGNWDVSVDCGELTSQGYGCVSDQQANVSNGNFDNLNFTVQQCQPLAVTTTYLPDAVIGFPYYYNSSNGFQLQNDGCYSPFTWSLDLGSAPLPAGLNLSTSGNISGTPATNATLGTNYFFVQVVDSQANTNEQLLPLVVYPAVQITNASVPNGTSGVAYNVSLHATGGRGGYFGWSLASGSLPLGLNINDGANFTGLLSGTPTQTGTFLFTVSMIDNSGYQPQRSYSMTIVPASLQITTSSLSNATVGVNYTNQLQASGGTTPYTWTLALGSQPLPAGLNIDTNGVISGMPTTAGTNNFIVRVTDHNSSTTTRALTLIVKAVTRPGISSPLRLSSRQFQLTVNGVAGQNYTVQYSLSLASSNNWQSLVVTNPGVSSFTVTDPNATNAVRFYRVLVGP